MKQKNFIAHSTLLITFLWLALLLTACGSFGATSPSPTAVLQPLTPNGFKGSIKVGGIFDLSGASAAEGRQYAAGVEAQIAYINSKGGVAGYKLELIPADYAFKAPLAIELYQKIQAQGAVAFVSWTTADTLAITRQLDIGKTPLFSASYADNIVRDGKRNPYNFSVAPTYSDQMKMALQWARVNHPEPYLPNRRLGVAFIYSDDNVGRFPLQTGREYAAAQKLFWYHEGVLDPELDISNIEFEMKRLKAAQPDFAFFQVSDKIMVQVLKIARNMGITTRFIGLNNTAAPDLPELAGATAEGFIATNLIAFPNSDAPGLQTLNKWLFDRSDSPILTLTNVDSQPAQKVTLPTQPSYRMIQGWVTMQTLAEGIRHAVATQIAKHPNSPLQLDGDMVKAGLETVTNYDTGGLTAPITFNAENHKGASQLRFYTVEKGRWQAITPFVSLEELENQPYKNQPTPTAVPPTPATPSPAPRR